MDQFQVLGFTAFLSILLFVTTVRNSFSIDYKTLTGAALAKLVLLDAAITAAYAVAGGYMTYLTFDLEELKTYRQYTVISAIVMGLSFKELLPILLLGTRKRVTGFIHSIGADNNEADSDKTGL